MPVLEILIKLSPAVIVGIFAALAVSTWLSGLEPQGVILLFVVCILFFVLLWSIFRGIFFRDRK